MVGVMRLRIVPTPPKDSSMRKALSAAALIGLTAFALAPSAIAGDSGGSGAGFTDRTNQSFTAHNGLTSEYHVYAADIPQDHSAGLILQFHGDGAYEFHNPNSSYSLGGSDGIVAQAKERGYITVVALTPDRIGEVTWWEDGAQNADYVADLVNSLKSMYNIDTEDIWLVGYSGGAQFITQFYLPTYSEQLNGGGTVVFGGGGRPRVQANDFSTRLVRDLHMHWYTGARDKAVDFDALSAARSGESWYRQRGFSTDLETPARVGHGLSGRFGPVLAEHLDAHSEPFQG